MKHLISFILCIAIICVSFTLSVAEELNVFQSGAYSYVLNEEGNAIITNHQEGEEKLILPSSLDGYTVTGIGKEAFYNDHFIKELVIPGCIKTIDDSAFAYTNHIRSVVLESGVERIGKEAFLYCQIYELTLPDTLVSLGDRAFACNNISSVQLPDSIQEIGINPFDICERLSVIVVSPDHPVLAVLDGVLFSKEDKRLVCKPLGLEIKEYHVPKGIRFIGERSFLGDETLAVVAIPGSVESVGSFAFEECVGLSAVTIEEGPKEIGEWAYARCSDLSQITIPGSVTKIGDKCFYDCSGLRDVNLSKGLESIGDEAFDGCIALTKIDLPNSVKEIVNNPFVNCERLRTIGVAKGNKSYKVVDGVLFTADMKKLICYPLASKGNQYVIPKGVEVIGEGSFYSCNQMISIEMPDSVRSIEKTAFAFCENLREINIPETAAEIGEKVFLGCDSLVSIKVARESVAADYCRVNALSYTYQDSDDWLNN